MKAPRRRKAGLRAAGHRREPVRFVLRLYVAGMSRTSSAAVARVHALCGGPLAGRYDLEVIDIHQLPALAKGHQIVATPTLLRVLPPPPRRYIGDMSSEQLLSGLELHEKRP